MRKVGKVTLIVLVNYVWLCGCGGYGLWLSDRARKNTRV